MIDNQLIRQLPRAEQARLSGLGETVVLRLAAVLHEPPQLTRQVYFPIDAFVAQVTPVPGRPGLAVGMVGHEGMLGAQLVLGVRGMPLQAVVLGAGTALRIAVPAFRAALAASPALRRLLLRYWFVRSSQLALSAGCLRYHPIAARLARWLLMSQDRARAPHFHVTHESVANLLGVRRVGITVAAGVLARRGHIAYRRGELTVLDRGGLEMQACGCYAADRQAYADILG